MLLLKRLETHPRQYMQWDIVEDSSVTFLWPVLLPLLRAVSITFNETVRQNKLIFDNIIAKATPFMVGVHLDGYEKCSGNPDSSGVCEFITSPSGGVGFKLIYWQNACWKLNLHFANKPLYKLVNGKIMINHLNNTCKEATNV